MLGVPLLALGLETPVACGALWPCCVAGPAQLSLTPGELRRCRCEGCELAWALLPGVLGSISPGWEGFALGPAPPGSVSALTLPFSLGGWRWLGFAFFAALGWRICSSWGQGLLSEQWEGEGWHRAGVGAQPVGRFLPWGTACSGVGATGCTPPWPGWLPPGLHSSS